MPKLLILVGIPFSERDEHTKFIKKFSHLTGNSYEIISRDACREYIFGPYYNLSPQEEQEVERDFNFKLKKAYLCRADVIHNSTNCSEWMIDRIIAECPTRYDIEVKFFNVSIYSAIWKNFIKYMTKGRWIPVHILIRLKRGFDAINKQKYDRYNRDIAITLGHF